MNISKLSHKTGVVVVETLTEKDNDKDTTVAVLQAKLKLMTDAFLSSRKEVQDLKNELARYREKVYKKSNIPTGTILIGSSRGKDFLAVVEAMDKIKVGGTVYASLSAAAEGVSGVRRSGWTFWRIPEINKTAKDVFKAEEVSAKE